MPDDSQVGHGVLHFLSKFLTIVKQRKILRQSSCCSHFVNAGAICLQIWDSACKENRHDYVLVWWCLWNFIVDQSKFKRFYIPIKSLKDLLHTQGFLIIKTLQTQDINGLRYISPRLKWGIKRNKIPLGIDYFLFRTLLFIQNWANC